MEHVISVLVENRFGVLAHIAGMFSGRGFNIESLSVAPTLDPTKSKMVITTDGNDQVIEQIKKQLNKLIIRAGLPGPHYTARRMAAPADDQIGEVPEPHTGDLLGEIFDL